MKSIRDDLYKLVKRGILAIVYSIDDQGELKDFYINGNQVIVRCPCCKKIVNVDKHNPKISRRERKQEQEK